MELIALAPRPDLSLGVLVDTQRQYSDVAKVYGAVAIVVFVIILVLVVTFALRFRGRTGSGTPSRVRDAPKLEAGYVTLLICVAAFLTAFTFIHEDQSDAALTAHPGLDVRVTAAKWHWTFFYPRYGVTELGTDSTPPTLYVPRGENIAFRLVSVDVIHAFWIPMTDFKRAAYPEYTQNFVLSFDRRGFFRNAGACAEFCGLLHAEMRFNVDVMGQNQFTRWMSSHKPA